MSVIRSLLILSVVASCLTIMSGQVSLQSFVSLTIKDEPAAKVFEEIQKQTGSVFSYGNFDDQIRVSIFVDQLPLQKVIPILENALNVRITSYDKYLIIKNPGNPGSKYILISGVISDFEKRVPVQTASVYNREKRQAVNTDQFGRFKLKLPRTDKPEVIRIAKKGYVDTTVIVIASKNQELNLDLRTIANPYLQELALLASKEVNIERPAGLDLFVAPEIAEPPFFQRFWSGKKYRYLHFLNIKDTLVRNFSLSFIPSISFNRLLSLNTINKLSLNIIGGHAKGVTGVELGTFYNLEEGSVSGLQMVGGFNQVKQNMTGLQVAGIMNRVSGNSAGVQIAGLHNATANLTGLQLAALMNDCDTLTGMQIGLVNRADHIKSGFMLGLVNQAENGLSKIEITTNDLSTHVLGYRSGWRTLHMQYFGAINLQRADFRFVQIGGGLASSIPITRRWGIEFGLTTSTNHGISSISSGWEFNLHQQFLSGLSWQPFKRFGIRAGITWHHFWYDAASSLNRHIGESISGNSIIVSDRNQRNHSFWPGWHLGIML